MAQPQSITLSINNQDDIIKEFPLEATSPSDIDETPIIHEFDVNETDEGLAEKLYKGIFDAPKFITEPAKGFADYMSQPDLDSNFPRLSGFVGGAVEGASKLLSPANIVSTALPALKPIAKFAPLVQKGLGALQLGHGTHEISEGNYLEGLGDIAFGALDISTSGLSRKLDSPLGKGVEEAGVRLDEPVVSQVDEVVPRLNTDNTQAVMVGKNYSPNTDILYLTFDGPNISPEIIQKSLPQVKGIRYRIEPLEGPGNSRIFRVEGFDNNGNLVSIKNLSDELGSNYFGHESLDKLNPVEDIQPNNLLKGDFTAKPITPMTPVQKLISLLKEAKPLNEKQREIYSLERAEKFGKAEDVDVKGEGDLGKFFSTLKGEHSKVSMMPMRDMMEQVEIDDLLKTITSSNLTVPETANAYTGLTKILDGRVPTDYEIGMLTKVFGEEFAKNAKVIKLTPRQVLTRISGIPKGLKSAFDFGFHFRQGINYAGRKSWFSSLIPAIHSYGSSNGYKGYMEALASDPMYPFAAKSGLAFTDLHGLSNREESAMGMMAENIPLLGAGAKAGNRAFTVAANWIRLAEFKNLYNGFKRQYESAMKLALTPEEMSMAKTLNPDNPFVAAKIADIVNTATGRGKLFGNLEKIVPELNATLFAPKLIMARMRSINRILNPLSYWNKTPVERKDALKQFFSIFTTAASTAMLFKSMGADVSLDPNSSDFLKIQMGKTRLDPLGGYQQYFVPVAKILMGSSVSTKSKREYELNSGRFGSETYFDVLERSTTNKTAPLASLGIAILKGQEASGQPVNFSSLNPAENSLTKGLVNPMILEDIYELYNEDPTLIPLMLPLSAFGQGVQVHSE